MKAQISLSLADGEKGTLTVIDGAGVAHTLDEEHGSAWLDFGDGAATGTLAIPAPAPEADKGTGKV